MAQVAIESPPAGTARTALTVAEVVTRIRGVIARQFPEALWIEGELSNCTYAASGHIYFSLVDERVTDRFGQRVILPCAFFRGVNQHLKFTLTDGLKLLCLGQITTYESKGQYQVRVLRVEPRGIGALQLAFEQLKKRLAAEGLFDEARKRSLPLFPSRIGVVTSRAGSVIHDMVSKLRHRFDVVVIPAKVEGEGAALEIIEAIETANRLRLADVLIVGRGGGSIEALWAFNEEALARALARSRIPVISAVGHEDDWTIADFVADLRASTPTDAAKLLVTNHQAVVDRARETVERLVDVMRGILDDEVVTLEHLREQLRVLHPAMQIQQHLDQAHQWSARLVRAITVSLEQADGQVQALAGRLHALSPLAVLGRGYSITFKRTASGSAPGASGLPHQILTSASSVHPGDRIATQLARGLIDSTVTETTLPSP